VQYPSNLLITSEKRDFTALIELRRKHQTAHAATSSKQYSGSKPSLATSTRIKLMWEFDLVIRQQEDIGVGTGLHHKVLWTRNEPSQTQNLFGNSANAEAVKDTAAVSKISPGFILNISSHYLLHCYRA